MPENTTSGVSALCQCGQLAEDAFLGAAAHAAPGARNDTVGTAPVAAVLYFHEGTGMPLQTFHGKLLEAFGFFMGRNVHNTATLLQKAQHVVQHAAARAGACDDVRFLYSQRFPGKGLRKAARQHGHRAGVPPLGAAQPLAAFLSPPAVTVQLFTIYTSASPPSGAGSKPFS